MTNDDKESYLYGGLAGAKLSCDEFDLGKGVKLKTTYAHLTAPHLLALTPPLNPGDPHPPPWRAAKGGFAFDIFVEMRVPLGFDLLGRTFDAKETIWWVAALLRLAYVPTLTVPVVSNQSFAMIRQGSEEADLQPFETTGRIFRPPYEKMPELTADVLGWAKDKWLSAARLLIDNPRLYTALKAFDGATVRGRTSASLLTMWGAIEQLFSPATTELRFRVSSFVAAYLCPPGRERLEMFRKVMKLYNERSQAAHSAKDAEVGPVVETYVLLRNALIRMIEEEKVPSPEELEALLFQDSPK